MKCGEDFEIEPIKILDYLGGFPNKTIFCIDKAEQFGYAVPDTILDDEKNIVDIWLHELTEHTLFSFLMSMGFPRQKLNKGIQIYCGDESLIMDISHILTSLILTSSFEGKLISPEVFFEKIKAVFGRC